MIAIYLHLSVLSICISDTHFEDRSLAPLILSECNNYRIGSLPVLVTSDRNAFVVSYREPIYIPNLLAWSVVVMPSCRCQY